MDIMSFDTHQQLSAITSTYKYAQRHCSEGYLFSLEKTWMLEANKKQISPKSYFLWK